MSASSAAAHVDPSARVLTVSSAVLRAQLGALVMFVVVGMCVVSSLVRHVSVMTSETLSRTGSLGQAGPGGESEVEGKRAGRSLVSMVLTSQAHRRCTPRTNRRIPTIPAGNIDGRIVHVSAVDTGPRRSESVGLGGTARRLRHRSAPCPLRRGPEAMTRRQLCLESRLESVYSTRVGIHWPMVVRTARRPHLPAVPPTLVQEHPTLVQCVQTTPAATTVTRAPLRQTEAAALPSGRPTPPMP